MTGETPTARQRSAVGVFPRVRLDHVGSHRRPVRAVQRFVELFTARAGEYQTRRQLPLLAPVGLEVVESERLKWGTVERVAAVKP